jgi:hypothetical protein
MLEFETVHCPFKSISFKEKQNFAQNNTVNVKVKTCMMQITSPWCGQTRTKPDAKGSRDTNTK